MLSAIFCIPPRIGTNNTPINKTAVTTLKGVGGLSLRINRRLKYFSIEINTKHRKEKIITNMKIGADETEAFISSGFFRYKRGVASILNPHAVYNSKSAVTKKDSTTINMIEYTLIIFRTLNFGMIVLIRYRTKGNMQI